MRGPLSITEAANDNVEPFIGTVEQISEMLRRYQEMGVAHVVFEPPIMAGIDAALAAMERFKQLAEHL